MAFELAWMIFPAQQAADLTSSGAPRPYKWLRKYSGSTYTSNAVNSIHMNTIRYS